MDARDGARHLYRAAEREQFYRKAVLRSVTTPAGEHFEALKG
jgi:hypothetical protein